MKFAAKELEIRRPLWIALSELYLDTEPDWERVASICAASPFDISELRRILFDEVHPIVHSNLWAAAGVWDGFNEDWLVTSILARKRRPLIRLPWPEERRTPWRELKPHIISARKGVETAP
ncbi:DUF7079 family protein [Thermomonas carbonis]|uniref:DUF7079 domain-containing protein n=1 Tax=Thermomonas carbonis TaxID=1463158 RepID=A0A7G9SND9_9GAMM|nr:hypothetical protein [Thermomonas carbonis]QNN69364.1 hypothetical protein H9L16_11860 [Thermomonas carbonis]